MEPALSPTIIENERPTLVSVDRLRNETARGASRHAPSFRAKCSRYGFSSRESDVLELVVEGKHVRDIAVVLGIAEATVHCHLRNAGIKLGCTKRSAMIAKMLLG